jgi:hypothetical protein
MKVISGGQTGVDQAGLDAAIALDIKHGGFCPRNRRSEKGPIPKKYELEELATFSYVDRTKQNIVDSDGTLIVTEGDLNGGTLMTKEFCVTSSKPLWVVDLKSASIDDLIRNFITFVTFEPKTVTLNVAGPRESKLPGIHDRAFKFLHGAFAAWKEVEGGQEK